MRRVEGIELGLLQEAGGTGRGRSPEATAEARALLKHFKSSSRDTFHAVDEFLIDPMTLGFLVEAGLEAFEDSARRLARLRLARQKLLLP